MKGLIVFCIIGFFSQWSLGWGGRGHLLICEAAIHRVKNPELKNYLMGKVQGITYLCNLPDIYWRSLPNTKDGDATHFFEPDVINLTYKMIPEKFADLEKVALGKTNLSTGKPVQSVASELGSMWWRVEQFFKLSLAAGTSATKSGATEKEDPDIYKMWVMMGLMGHFVGDNSQPFHNTYDYDGWKVGHGGIHSYYETTLVNELPPTAVAKIANLSESKRNRFRFDSKMSIIEKMRALSQISHDEIDLILKADPILKPSQVKSEKGMELRKPAERRPPVEVIKSFEPMITLQMSRSAALLADLWDKIYVDSGKPPVGKDKSFQFPHAYEFIPPEY